MTDGLPNDRALAEAIVSRGDEAAFRLLYRRHAGALHAFVQRWLDAEPDRVDDVLQETWLRAVQRLSSFEWRSSFRTWLIAIAVNCCREATRAHQLQLVRADVADDPPAAGVNPDARIDLESVLSQLADGYRHVLLLHDVFGLTHDEISVLLGIEVGTSKSQLSRARATLRRLLGPAYSAPSDPDSAHA